MSSSSSPRERPAARHHDLDAIEHLDKEAAPGEEAREGALGEAGAGGASDG